MNPSKPLVSVVVPCYNHARFLSLRIKTILEQTFQDFEIIFLDDASTDESLQVARELLHDRAAQMVINPENSKSPFKQWNRGVALARRIGRLL